MKRVALFIAGPLLVSALAPIPIGIFSEWRYLILMIGGLPIVMFCAMFVAAPIFAYAIRKDVVNLWTFAALAFAVGFCCYLYHSIISSPEYHFTWSDASTISETYVDGGHWTGKGWWLAVRRSLIMGLLSIPGGWLWLQAARTPRKTIGMGLT